MRLSRWLRHYDIDRLDQRDPEWIDLVYRMLHRPLEKYFRAEVRGIDHIPPGPALYVCNHNAVLMSPDSFLFGAAVYRERGLKDLAYGLGHETVFNLPVVNQLLVPLGTVRAGHRHALELFAQGHKVMVYPGGEYDSMRSWRDRDRIRFGGRSGFIRLALTADVPIVPVVTAGAHETLIILTDGQWIARVLHLDRLLRLKALPISLALPWGLLIAPFPFIPWPSRILIEVLPPIRFDRSGPKAAADAEYVTECAAHVEQTMQECLTRLAAERRAS